ncbi:lipoyl(octanoyl) transferase LipB [bacterium]|nr:lipoyl(octanoyl) transferase LipB [bacterium]
MLNTNRQIEVLDWGLVEYREAFRKQEELVQKIIEKETSEKLIFCSHPPIVTLGRGTKPGDVFAWKGDTMEVNRGGRATYHGPSQLIAYPLISLEKTRDLHLYMRLLEQSVLDLLLEFEISSQGRSFQQQVGEDVPDEATGVWVGSQKVAAIGIAVKKWITSHGIALNVFEDSQAFQGFYPCGFQTSQVVSLEKLLGKQPDVRAVQKSWQNKILQYL